MKNTLLNKSLFMFIFFIPQIILSVSGKKLFNQRGCASCHDSIKDRAHLGLGPSVLQIQKAYNGDVDRLILFLKGQSFSLVYPSKYPVMSQQISRIKDLNEKEYRALAEYILKM